MRITYQSREFTPTEKYLMTKSPSIISVKNVEDGTLLEVTGYLHYEDEDRNGNISCMLDIFLSVINMKGSFKTASILSTSVTM